jgi:hypothetical protein
MHSLGVDNVRTVSSALYLYILSSLLPNITEPECEVAVAYVIERNIIIVETT